jgi:hypothetical protein
VRLLVSGSWLVTLTGAGGAGKTRLALQVAAGLADGAGEGVWFADLAPLGDPDLVAVTVADVLAIRQEPGRPVLETLVEAVGGRSLLVVLDNCEQRLTLGEHPVERSLVGEHTGQHRVLALGPCLQRGERGAERVTQAPADPYLIAPRLIRDDASSSRRISFCEPGPEQGEQAITRSG